MCMYMKIPSTYEIRLDPFFLRCFHLINLIRSVEHMKTKMITITNTDPVTLSRNTRNRSTIVWPFLSQLLLHNDHLRLEWAQMLCMIMGNLEFNYFPKCPMRTKYFTDEEGTISNLKLPSLGLGLLSKWWEFFTRIIPQFSSLI